jgi:ribonuclease R
MLAAQWMTPRIGERFHARITRVKPFGLIVQIDTTQVEGVVPLEALVPKGDYRPDARETSLSDGEHVFTIGMALEVELIATDPALGRIEFGLAV